MSLHESMRGGRIAAAATIFMGALGLYGCGSTPSGPNKLNLLNCSKGPKANSANFADLEHGQAVNIGDAVLTSHGNGEFSLDMDNGDSATDRVNTTGQFIVTQDQGSDDPIIRSTGTGQHVLNLLEGNQQYSITGFLGGAAGTEINITASCT